MESNHRRCRSMTTSGSPDETKEYNHRRCRSMTTRASRLALYETKKHNYHVSAMLIRYTIISITVLLCGVVSIPSWMTPLSTSPPQVSRRVEATHGSMVSQSSPWPRIVWLMSFPNSGTSYTMRLVSRTTHTLTATNYITESSQGRQLHPVYFNHSEGPFWPGPNQSQYVRPSNYVLTKTHCGNRCNDCVPKHYLDGPLSFARQCSSGSKSEMALDGQEQTVRAMYDSQLVHKAVHLIRNPFDNIVSRFHLERHKMMKLNATQMLAFFPDSREGFRRFCGYMDYKYKSMVEASWLADKGTAMRNVRCRDDFFRYVQWHNHAFTTTDELLQLPTFILHYEDFVKSFSEKVSELLDFLDLEQVSDPYPFKQGHSYDDYFSKDERNAVKDAMKSLSTPTTWQHIQHYFD